MTLLVLIGASPVLAATLTVDPVGPADYSSLQTAIDVAEEGDTIEVNGGEWGALTVAGKRLTIDMGEQPSKLTQLTVLGSEMILKNATFYGVDAGINSASSTLQLQTVSFEGQGDSQTRPAIWVQDGSFDASEVSVADWGQPEAAPMHFQDSAVSFETLTVTDTRGLSGGALSAVGGSLSIIGGTFTRVHAIELGGALYLEGVSTTLQDVAFSQVSASSGGALAAVDGELTMTGVSSDIAGARERGGAFWLLGTDAVASDVEVRGGSATQGGAFCIDRGSFVFTDLKASDNRAQEGGHFWVGGKSQVEITRSELSGGEASRGAGIFVEDGMITAQNAIWTYNIKADAGGAYYQEEGGLKLSFAVLAGNSAEIGSAIAIAGGFSEVQSSILTRQSGGDSYVSASSQPVYLSASIAYELGELTTGDVQLTSVQQDTDPEFVGGSWVPGPYSAALDRVLTFVDVDGTYGDIGAYGGPDAWPLADADGDGYTWGRDCDDNDAEMHEDAPDRFYDGVDSDCRGDDDFDADGDGYSAANFGGEDCDDVSADRYPGAEEFSGDQYDSDCDGLFDIDSDGDGWAEGVDCDDSDPSTHPWAQDTPYDGVDSDCLGDSDYDADGDGWEYDRDCDDADPSINPSTPEILDDGVDQDCDGQDQRSNSGGDDLIADGGTNQNTGWRDEVPWVPGETDQASMGSGGCSTASGGSGGLMAGLLAVFGLMALRRRRED